ncbi:MAG TPA: (2Fe-2S)-binding protein [Clostridiaceae bacterium]
MGKEFIKKSCSSNRIMITNKIKKNNTCPLCGRMGKMVKNVTVKHLITDEFMGKIGNEDYYLCMDENCDIVYYDLNSGIIFSKQQVKVPIWFKDDANPKYACYCSKVTEEEVINAVVKDGATIMSQVLKITGAMSEPNCQNNNPLGQCCHKIVQEAINKGLAILNQ